MTPEKLLQAASAELIPEGYSGLWYIKKFYQKRTKPLNRSGRIHLVPPGQYTHLFRMTEGTLHQEPPGVVVMEDTPLELRTHLEFMLRAEGRVLISGLGLGCVVRGCLANPKVTHITCLENSYDVLKLVQPYMPQDDRLRIIETDALWWIKNGMGRFDCAWHDLWSNREDGEDHLDIIHTRLIMNCIDKVEWQGAWKYSRQAKEFLKRKKVRLVG